MHCKGSNDSGFTLIEVLIAVTISALIFAWLITFVMSGLSSVGRTQKSVENSIKGSSYDRMIESLSTQAWLQLVWTGALPAGMLTGVLLETTTNADPYVFVWVQSFTGYCATDPSRVLQRLVTISGTTPRVGEVTSVGGFTIDPEKQSIFQWATRVIGTLSSGDTLSTDPLATELSNPSSLAQIWNTLFIADTGNSRVLAYDTVAKSIKKVVDAKNWIVQPVSLAVDGADLLIWCRNGLFRLHESTEDGTSSSATLQSPNSLTFDTIALSFSGISTLTQPTPQSDTVITGLTSGPQDPTDTVSLGSSLTYSFTGGARTQTASMPINIRVSNIAPAPSAVGSYALSVKLLLGGSTVYESTSGYFTKSDNDITTLTGQIITRVDSASRVSLVTSAVTYSKGLLDISSFLSGSWLTSAASGSPVSDVVIQRNGNLLTLIYKNFDIYDCSPDEHHRQTTHVQKIWVRDPD